VYSEKLLMMDRGTVRYM